MRSRCHVVSLAVLGLCACVPHRQTVAPQVLGTINDCGKPASGVVVGYTHQAGNAPECSAPDALASTDEDGSFSFKAGKVWRFFVEMGDPVFFYQVCARQAEQWTLLWSDFARPAARPPAAVEIRCDLRSPIADLSGGKGRCSRRDANSEQSSLPPRITSSCNGP